MVHLPTRFLSSILACCFAAAAAAQQTPPLPPLFLDPAPGGGQPIVLRMVGAETISTPVVLRRNADNPAAVTGLAAYVLQGKDKAAVVLGAKVALTDVTGAVDLLKTPQIPALPAVQPAILTVSGIKSDGIFTGQLVAQVPGALVAIASFEVERLPAPEVKWAGEPAPGTAIQLSASRMDFVHTFILTSLTAAPAEDLQLKLGALTDPVGHQIATTWRIEGKDHPGHATVPLKMEGQSTTAVTLHAQIPPGGPYTTTLALRYGGNLRTTNVVVNRPKPATASVAVLGLGATRAVTWPIVGGDLPVWMTLQDASNQGVSIAALAPATLTLKDAQRAPAPAEYAGAPIYRMKKKGDDLVTLPLALGPAKTELVEMRIQSLRHAGEYTGTLLVTTTDGEVQSKEFALLVKRHWWWAALWIGLGVVVSNYIREYQKNVRPRLLQQENHRQLENDAAVLQSSLPTLEAEERRVWDLWQAPLSTLGGELARGAVADADARLALLNHQLSLFPKWVKARREVLGLPDPVAGQFEQTVRDARDYLIGTSEKPDDFQKHQTALDQLGGAITQARQSELNSRLAALITASGAQRAELATGEGRAALDMLLERARLGLTGEFEAQERTFRDLRADYVRLLAADLEAMLRNTAAPVGFSAAEWKALAEAVAARAAEAKDQAAIDADQALATYRAAIERYLREVSTKLQEEGRRRQSEIEALPAADPTRAARLEKAKEIVTHTASALVHLGKAELREASEEYRAAKSAHDALAPQPGRMAVAEHEQHGEAAAAVLADALQDRPAFGASPSVPARSPRALMALSQIKSTRICMDRLLSFLVLAIAVALGLKVLWADDPIWGGWTACLTALLWGLGVNQVSKEAFEGTAGLLGRFTK